MDARPARGSLNSAEPTGTQRGDPFMTQSLDRSLSKPGEVLQPTGWLEAANYEFTLRLARREWAWEFLRRNKHYALDWNLSQSESVTDRPFVRLKVDAGMSRMQRWGLIFRRCAKQEGRRR